MHQKKATSIHIDYIQISTKIIQKNMIKIEGINVILQMLSLSCRSLKLKTHAKMS